MDWLYDRAIAFFAENFPSPRAILLGGPPALLWAYAALAFAGHLKCRRGLRTGYTRKTFHFLIFGTVAFVHWQWGASGVLLFGAMTSLVILYALLRGDGHPLYEAMAREKDAPHRTHFIVAPYFATLLGGVASNILFGPLALAGYLVAGIGDAIAEPVGVRFGRHTYRVPSSRGVPAVRSWEGSTAVFLASIIALALTIHLLPHLAYTPRLILLIPLFALACAVTESISPHGWDNATLQILPSFLAWLIS